MVMQSTAGYWTEKLPVGTNLLEIDSWRKINQGIYLTQSFMRGDKIMTQQMQNLRGWQSR